jgi:pimeloyl-CoA dehydrogenase
MDLELDAAQAAFREEVRAFLRDRLPPEVRERMRKGLRPSRQQVVDWQRALHAAGPRRTGRASSAVRISGRWSAWS